MDQNQLSAQDFLAKFNRNEVSSEEHAMVTHAFNSFAAEAVDRLPEIAMDQVREEIWARLPVGATSKVVKVRKLWRRIGVAAAMVLFVGLGVYFYANRIRVQDGLVISAAEDIAPGGNGATLTLASGKKIRLNDAESGQLAEEAGVMVKKDANGELVYEVLASSVSKGFSNMLSTAKGETYAVILPDGTKAWLNAASSLTYSPSLIVSGKRLVSLSGEAYFEVAKDKAHPFVVQTARQQVEVLGTHFNVNSYLGETTVKTTLLEGSVKVSSGAQVKMLQPNQQAILSADGNIGVGEADATVAIAWKNNQFMFESENIQTVMRMVERWYNVEVFYEGEISEEKFWGGVSRFDKVSKVLKSLEETGKVRFRLEGRKIYVSK